MKASFARLVLKLWRWTPVGVKPSRGSVIICAPHTSNVDYLLMILVAWTQHMNLSWLGKAQLFKPPLGWLMRATGGVSVDRSAPQGMVGQLTEEFGRNPDLMLAIPAEGTRSHTEYWKSGFYRIAVQAKVPMSLAFIDKSTHTVGFGPEIEPTGDLVADMAVIREFYAGKVGLKPANFGPVRLREEEPDEGAAAG
ncbi:MAG: 1-acyl-sn-glycerol-3-phosphate acyltransferase [Acidimicrobiales bacterium]